MTDRFSINPELMELVNDYGFYERLVGDSRVEGDPPVGSDTVFDDQFERRANELTRKPYAGAKPVSLVDQRKGPWSGNNQLGNELPFAPDINNQQTILKLDEWGMPEVWSVMLGADYQFDDAADVFGFGIEAIVDIGCGGITQQVVLDWVEGTTFQAPMNAINVRARYQLGLATIPSDLVLRVNLARGALATRGPTSTVRDFGPAGLDLAAGATKVFKIPKFAHRVQVVSAGAAGGINTTYDPLNRLNFRTGTAGADVARFNGDQLLQFPDGVPIPNVARYVAYTNNSASSLDIFAMIFFLAL